MLTENCAAAFRRFYCKFYILTAVSVVFIIKSILRFLLDFAVYIFMFSDIA